jgi:hypothetical protein
LITSQINLEEAIAEGLILIEGDPDSLSRFLKIAGVPILN